jgi:hypothetical protein
MCYLLLLGAYRDNEVSPSHPLMLTLDEIRKSGALLEEIVLGPLTHTHLAQLAADTVHRPAKAAAPLARLVYDKTDGNPFFAIQFLTTLYQERLLAYDEHNRRWRWGLPAIRQQSFTDNVVELMIGKLRRLPAATQEALMLAACVGHAAEAGILGVICDRAEDQIHADLREAVDQGLLLRRDDVIYETIRLEQQFVACLKGLTRQIASFDDSTFNEAVSFARITEAAFGIGIVIYHTLKQIAAFIYGQYAEALESAVCAAPKLYAVMSMPVEATYHFYHALTLAALYMQAPAEQRREFAATLAEELRRLKLWGDNCPENFLNRYALVAAEAARIEGRDLDAERLYEQAIRSAHEQGFVQNEGLAYELAAQFYSARGFELFADTYLREARACYARWGADGKVKQLDQHYPQLVEARPLEPTVTFAARAEQLDLLSVIKASQSISRTILLPNLQETLMRIVLEHAGAQRGLLLLVEGEDLAIHAHAEIAGEETQVSLAPALLVSAATLPVSILSYVRRTGESVVLADAAAEGSYAADEYIARQQPRSVLCLPIVRQAHLAGRSYSPASRWTWVPGGTDDYAHSLERQFHLQRLRARHHRAQAGGGGN